MGNKQNEQQQHTKTAPQLFIYTPDCPTKDLMLLSERHAAQKDTNEHLRGWYDGKKSDRGMTGFAKLSILFSYNSLAVCF